MTDLLVIGSAGPDLLACGEHAPGPDGSAVADRFLETPGGRGVNQAVAAVHLGASAW